MATGLYLCHFLLDEQALKDHHKVVIYLIDLHRAQIRDFIPLRWLIKDLASLYYSSLNLGLSIKDYLRFIKKYTGAPLKDTLSNKYVWEEVMMKTYKLTNRSAQFEKKVEQ